MRINELPFKQQLKQLCIKGIFNPLNQNDENTISLGSLKIKNSDKQFVKTHFNWQFTNDAYVFYLIKEDIIKIHFFNNKGFYKEALFKS